MLNVTRITVAVVAIAAPALAQDLMTYTIEGKAAEATLVLAGAENACLRVTSDAGPKLRVVGQGTLALHVRADAAPGTKRVKFTVTSDGKAQSVRVRARRRPGAVLGPDAAAALASGDGPRRPRPGRARDYDCHRR